MVETKIVLVENESSPLVSVRDALKKAGLEVTSCGGAFDALDELASQGADVVVSATNLADMTGYQLSCLIKSDDRTHRLPVVLIDAESDRHNGFWSSAALADSTLTLKELKSDNGKLVNLVTSLAAQAREQGWDPAVVKEAGVVPGAFSSRDLISSYTQLVGDLLVERLAAYVARSAAAVIEPRKKFLDHYFGLVNRFLNCQCTGIILASAGNPWGSFHISQPASQKSFDEMVAKLTRQLEIHKDLSVDVRGELKDDAARPIGVVDLYPVKSDRAVLGALVFTTEKKKGFDATARSIMLQLQTHMQVTMRLLQANQEIEQLYQREQYRASTDPLTGLYNLEFLVGFLQQQLLFSYRQRQPVGFLIVDVDHFKEVNDEFGYEIGDLVLSTIANRMLNQTRGSDLIARYGGDQFAVVAPNTDAPGTRVLGEKIRAEVEQMTFVKGPGRKGPRVTVSIGAASFDMEDLNPETILRNAKMALKKAKEAGGNRVAN